MSTETQKIETISKRNASLRDMKADEKTANTSKVKAMKQTLQDTATVATFHVTKGLRIASGFAGKFVVNLCNSEAKNAKDEGVELSSLVVLDNLRNAKNYENDVLSDTVKPYFTIGRVNAYARILGKKYDCVLSDKDVYACVQLVATKLFTVVTK